MSGRATHASLGSNFEQYLTRCFGTALSSAKAVVEDGQSAQRLGNNNHHLGADGEEGSSDSLTMDSLASLMDACEHVLEDACACCSVLSATDPPPVVSVPFIATPSALGGFLAQLVEVLSTLHDLDDLVKSVLASAGDRAVAMSTESSNLDEDQQGQLGDNSDNNDEKDTSAEEDREHALRSFLRDSRESISCAMESALESLTGMVQLAENDTLLAAMSADADVQRMALVLCRYSASCYESVSMSSVMLIGLLAQKDGLIREQRPSSMLIQPRINALLSNAVLRVLETHVDKVTATMGATATASVGTLLDQLGVVDTALGAFIDLHASDDLDLLQNFVRLNALQRLTDLVAFFDKSVNTARQLRQQQQGGGKSKSQSKNVERMVTGDSGEDEDEDESRLSDMLSDFEGTTSNAKSFLEYKTLYVNR